MPDPSRIRTKICGLTSVADAQFTASLGADAIGLVFYDKSPRFVSIKVAQSIAASVGPFVTVVGLFVNADESTINRVLSSVPLHVIQFHGTEKNDFCRRFKRPFIKAVRMAPNLDPNKEIAAYPDASGLLFDAYQAGIPGGTGTQFEWDRFPVNPGIPCILAGGLKPNNIQAAVLQTKPYGVDVSGGVESSPGKKCPEKVAEFIRQAKLA